MTGLFPQRSPHPHAALRDITSDKPRVRCAAAEALGNVRDLDIVSAARSALVRASMDMRPEVRATAVLSLGELGGDEAIDALIERLADGNSDVRQSAAVALGTIGNSRAVPALLRALESGPPDLRFQAVTTLAELDAAAARDPLIAALDDDDAEVVGAAAIALGAIDARGARDRIHDRLADHGPKTSFDLAYALADLGDARAAPVLACYASDAALGWDAVVALEKLGSTSADALSQVLSNPKAPATVRLRAAAAVLSVCDPTHSDARSQLLDGLRSRKSDERGLAVESLERVGATWAVEALRDLSRRWSGRRLRAEIEAAIAAIEKGEPS